MAALMVLAMASACGDDGPAAESGGEQSNTSSAAATSSSSESPRTSEGTTSSTAARTDHVTPSTDDAAEPPEGEAMSFDELRSRQQDLVGETVEVEGKVFFDPQCPPPGGPSGPCIANGFLADPELNGFTAADTEGAFPIVEGDGPVSCVEEAAGAGCAGWDHARRYRVVATVQHRISGGRETEQVELVVKDKTPI